MRTLPAAPPGPLETDAVVIGAGPVGLYQVFALGLQGIHAHLVDALPHTGGQCAELYPDKPIFDIPGIPMCTGKALVHSLEQQIAPFEPVMHLGQLVVGLKKQEDRRFLLEMSGHTQLLTKTVFIAAGVGAFLPRTLKLDGLDAFEGKQLAYRVDNPATYAGKSVVIHGDSEEALRWAITLALGLPDQGVAPAKKVTLVYRRDVFQAQPETELRFRELQAQGFLSLLIGQISGLETDRTCLTALQVTIPDGQTVLLPLDQLLVLLGLSPKLGPKAQGGLALERKQKTEDTEQFSTQEPGIFAVGDINNYPGKRKLILCGFHEATLAAFGAAAWLNPGEKIPLQYTTTSAKLHNALGYSACENVRSC
jgi:thioredoxin reductase (NADPH)